jgi:protein-disulfide isomerase
MSRRVMFIAGVVVILLAGVAIWSFRTAPPPPSATTAAAPPPVAPATSSAATSTPASSTTPATAPAPAATPTTASGTSTAESQTPAPAAASGTSTAESQTPAPQAAVAPPALPKPTPGGPTAGPDDRILGKADAPITIFEYASFTCPHCADFDANTLPKLRAAWLDTGKARLIFRDYPLDAAAVRAAMLARCAPPEQFYAFVDELFHSQMTWASGGKVEAALGKLAKLSGMSDDQFAACMKDEAGQKRVLDSRLEAEQTYKVESTPTFFVNGTQIVGAQPYAEFERVLNKASQP